MLVVQSLSLCLFHALNFIFIFVLNFLVDSYICVQYEFLCFVMISFSTWWIVI